MVSRFPRALISAALLLATAAHRPAPPPDLGTLVLDRTDPVVPATIAGVTLRLSLAPDARDVVELAPETAARLDLPWERGSDEDVGRVRIRSRVAVGAVEIGGVARPMVVGTHDRPCCDGQDGAIGPLLLPWSTIRLGDRAPYSEHRQPARVDDVSGLFIPWPTPAGEVRLILSPRAPRTIATASAAAILAKAYGGRFEGQDYQQPIAFGISRQVRDMVFATPPVLAGLPLARLAVRYADFAGDTRLPQEEDAEDGIVVRKRGPRPQRAWPAVTIGADLLARCPAIAFYRIGPTVGLSCP